MSTTSAPVYCARHPNVETGLSCGRCETPICPKCVVMTDVGGRCPTCAPRRKLPQLEISPVYLLRGGAAAAAAGGIFGGIWGLLLPGSFGIFAVFVGIGLGYATAEAVSLATNRKFGPLLQLTACLGVLLAYIVRSLIADGTPIPTGDLFGYIVAGVGIIAAANRLRA